MIFNIGSGGNSGSSGIRTVVGSDLCLEESKASVIKVLNIKGKSVQDGTPTVKSPKGFRNAAESGSLQVKASDKNTEPCQSNTIIIVLAQPLRECDKIVKQNGVWGVLRGTKVVLFGGTWQKRAQFAPSDGSACYSSADFITDNMKSTEYMYMACTHLTFGGGVAGGADISRIGKKGCFYKISIYVSTGGTTTYVCSDAQTVEDFMAEMEGAVFEYELAEPVFEPLPDELQIPLNNLEAYAGVTYVTTDGEVKAVLNLQYGVTESGAYVLEALSNSEVCKIKLDEINKALPYAINIDDKAKTIDFTDR